MSLADLMRKGALRAFATATPATPATEGAGAAGTVATVATVAVAKAPDSKTAPDPDRWCWPHSEAWNTVEIERFLARRARLMRWGWAEPEAEALAERLTVGDRDGTDDRVSCTDCRHYRPGRCGNHKAAGLMSPDVSRDLAAMLQRCPGFQPLAGDMQ